MGALREEGGQAGELTRFQNSTVGSASLHPAQCLAASAFGLTHARWGHDRAASAAEALAHHRLLPPSTHLRPTPALPTQELGFREQPPGAQNPGSPLRGSYPSPTHPGFPRHGSCPCPGLGAAPALPCPGTRRWPHPLSTGSRRRPALKASLSLQEE